jgi:Serine/Threonine/Tyrosine Kinase found in polyvalent proteins
LADAIFYASWFDYFTNLLLHNSFFPNTRYEFIGFIQKNDHFYAIVKQPFIGATENTKLEHVKEFLLSNGFEHKKNNDYYHPGLGIILEDLHDENVLTNSGVLFFVDTVFYLTESFYGRL